VRRLLGNLLLSVTVSVLLLGGLEGASRLLEERAPRPERADYLWDWEARWEGDFYTLASDESGWPPGAEFNGDGVRDRAHAVEKPEGTWRVVFLGDSVTFGDGNAPGEAYPQQLQARLDAEGRPVEVFNVALWGWSTRQQRLAYERIARQYAPDHVVLAVCLNDIPEMQNNLARPPRWLASLHRHSALARRLIAAERREIASVEELFADERSPRVERAFDLFFGEVRRLRDAVRSDGAQLGVLVFPFLFQLEPGAPPPRVQERIREFCRAEEMPCFDPLPEMRREGASLFNDYDHLSPAGGRFVAAWIVGSGLLPRAPSADEVLAGHLGPGGGSPSAWFAALAAREASVRAAAAWKLGRLADEAALAVPRLEQVLGGDESERVRAEAARALGQSGPTALGAVPALLQALSDPRQAVRWAAADALHRIGVAPAHSQELADAARSEDPYVRAFATFTLGNLGADAGEAAVPALVETLKREGGAGRAGAAAALARLGPAASAAVPALVEELRNADPARRARAARALGRIGASAAPAVNGLLATLADPEPSVRLHSARALGRIGEGARAAIPALVEALEDPDPDVRQEALAALSRIPAR
jgi:HEAT repeat protein/lysophospholipase L1-like esterase